MNSVFLDKIKEIKDLLDAYHKLNTCEVIRSQASEIFLNRRLYPPDYLLFLKEIGTVVINENGFNRLYLDVPQNIEDIEYDARIIWEDEVHDSVLDHLGNQPINKNNYSIIGFDVDGTHYGFINKSGEYKFYVLHSALFDSGQENFLDYFLDFLQSNYDHAKEVAQL